MAYKYCFDKISEAKVVSFPQIALIFADLSEGSAGKNSIFAN
jgi:hypothetical protein